MQLPLSCKALLFAGLLFCSLPTSIQAAEIDPTEVINIEQVTVETKEDKASFNMTAFFAALACNTVVVAATTLPAMLLHAIMHRTKYTEFSNTLVREDINPFGKECHNLFKASFPSYYSLLSSLDYIENYANIGLAVKMGMETEPTASIKEICLRSLKNVKPYALCAAAIACVGALF